MIWFLLGARTTSTGSSTSARTRLSSSSDRAGTTIAVSSTGSRRRDRLDRDPVVVGGGQCQLIPFEPAQDTGQDRPGLVARRGERRLVEGLPERSLGDPGRRPLAGRRDGRELLGIDPLDVGLEPARPDPQGVAGLELEVDPLAGRQARDDIGQQLGRDGDRAVDVDLGRDPVGDPDLEVRGSELQAAVLGPDEDVAEDRQGAPRRDRATHDRQAAGEVLLHDRDVHGRFTPGRRALVWRGFGGSAGCLWTPRPGLGHRPRGSVGGLPPYLRTSSSPSCGGWRGRPCSRPHGSSVHEPPTVVDG